MCMFVSVLLRKNKSWEYKTQIPVTVSRKESTQFIIQVTERFIIWRRNKTQTISPLISQNPPQFCHCSAFSSASFLHRGTHLPVWFTSVSGTLFSSVFFFYKPFKVQSWSVWVSHPPLNLPNITGQNILHQTFYNHLMSGVVLKMLEAEGACPCFMVQVVLLFLSSTPPSVHLSSPDACWE